MRVHNLCGETPLTCVFFNASCLETSGGSNGTNSTASIGLFMTAITRGFNFDSMLSTFGSAIVLFCLARAGGIPVPSTTLGRGLWWSVIIIQLLQYVLQSASLLMNFLAYLNLRHQHNECMRHAMGLPVMDICMLTTWLAIPMVSQGLLVLFIYAYV